VDSYLSYFRQQLITCPLSALLPFQLLIMKVCGRSAPCSSPLLQCGFTNSVPLVCVSFRFLVNCSGFLFLQGGQSAQGAMLVCPRGAWGILHDAWYSSVCLLNVSQVGLESLSGGVAALLFSQCNVAWSSFPQARCSGC
jgi:hypothetical protein